jgi:signal transduction histidine kinase/Tfp pilus assembly protein PilF
VQPQDARILEKTNNLREKVGNTKGKEKLTAYLELIDYLTLNQPDKALLEKDSILTLAKNLNDDKALIKIYLTLGESYSETHKNELALEYFEKGLELSKKLKDSSKIAKSFIKIGRMKIPAGELDQALMYFENALDISERNKDIHNQIFAINYLGILNYILDNIQEAENLSIKGLELSRENNFTDGICLACEHLAIIKIKQGKFEEALEFNKTAYDISLQKDFIANIPGVYFNFAVIYSRLGDYDKAIDYMNKSEELRKSFNDIRGMASDIGMLGRIYLAKKDYKNAIDKFQKAQEIYKEYNAVRPLIPLLNGLANAYENIGDYKTALKYFKEFKTFSDSVYNENVKRQTAISNAQRQLEEKEKEIKYLEEINKAQNKIQTYLIIFSAIIFVLFVSTIFLYVKVRKSRQNLSEINQKLIALNNERNKFFSVISHDLKSPFLGILGLTDLLKEELNNSEVQRSKELIDKLDKAVNNQYKLVDNLLNWTRIQSGKMLFEPKEFVLTEVLNEVIETLNNFSLQKNIRIKTNIEKDFLVWADRNMISSVLRNLISNAIKYSYEDSDVSVIISQKSDDFISVQIKDSGIGIAEANVSKIFRLDSNVSTEGTAKEKGTGLGLLIVKEMISMNKGEISVISKENLGSIFEFTLPIARK